jgi:hypothetical protein
MRRCAAPLIKDRSGDLSGMAFVVYGLGPALSRALSCSACAAAAMVADVFGRVVGCGEPAGFNGNGGGARSGSALSHLRRRRRDVSGIERVDQRLGFQPREDITYIGTARPWRSKECECFSTSRSRSWDRSLSTDMVGRVWCGMWTGRSTVNKRARHSLLHHSLVDGEAIDIAIQRKASE